MTFKECEPDTVPALCLVSLLEWESETSCLSLWVACVAWRPQHPAAALTHPGFRCFLFFVFLGLFFWGFFFALVFVDLDSAPGAFAHLLGWRRRFKLWLLGAAVLERRMVVGAGWSPWRHPDPSSCLSAHSDKWLRTGQMGLLSPTHSSLDARGTGQHSPPPIAPASASIELRWPIIRSIGMPVLCGMPRPPS